MDHFLFPATFARAQGTRSSQAMAMPVEVSISLSANLTMSQNGRQRTSFVGSERIEGSVTVTARKPGRTEDLFDLVEIVFEGQSLARPNSFVFRGHILAARAIPLTSGRVRSPQRRAEELHPTQPRRTRDSKWGAILENSELPFRHQTIFLVLSLLMQRTVFAHDGREVVKYLR